MTKTKKAKLPKRIGGVKIPKELREVGGAILEKANSPAGREMLAAGLTMAAATAALQRKRGTHPFSAASATPPPPPAAPAAPAASPAPTEPGKPGLGDPQALADAIGNAADAMLTQLFGTRKRE